MISSSPNHHSMNNNHHSSIPHHSSNINGSNGCNVKKQKSMLHQSKAPFPSPISSLSRYKSSTTYKSPVNRKRNRESGDNCSKSPNINNALKRQRRKITATSTKSEEQKEQIQNSSTSNLAPPTLISLSPPPKSKNTNAKQRKKSYKNGKNTNTRKNKSNSRKKLSVEDWSETDHDFTEDDDYRPPIKDNNVTSNISSSSCSDSEDNGSDTASSTSSKPSGYRDLHWRKKEVATPKFIIVNTMDPSANINIVHTLLRQQSTPNININHDNMDNMDKTLLKRSYSSSSSSASSAMLTMNEEIEDTSNQAYFYRHYRAEAREKLFYEELFESRMKQQQILEEKEKRKKKKKKRGRGRKKTIKSKSDNSDDNGLNIDNNDNGDNNEEIDLSLPKIPKGPWTFKLGSEYDKKPIVPSIVSNKPQFNYHIPYKQLENKQLIMDENKRLELDNWWKMPTHLIRRTDYGNMGNVVVPIKNNNNNNIVDEKDEKEEKRKQELIQMYKLLKQAEKTKNDNVHKNKNKKNKTKTKTKTKKKLHKIVGGPVDIRSKIF